MQRGIDRGPELGLQFRGRDRAEGSVEELLGEPAQHVGVQEPPVRTGQDDRPSFGARLHEALGGQDLGRFPNDGPTDAEHPAQLALFWEDLARRQFAPHDPPADALDDARVDAAGASLARDHGLR